MIEISPRTRQYEPYDFLLLGTPTVGYNCNNAVTPTQRLAVAWRGMMWRCYNPLDKGYALYGQVGVSVCKRWHQVANFIHDVRLIHGWEHKLANWSEYQLDKDYYKSNQYSPETCVWLSTAANSLLKGQPVYVTNPYGVQILYLSVVEVSQATGLHRSSIQRYLKYGTAIKKGRLKGYLFKHAKGVENIRHTLGELH